MTTTEPDWTAGLSIETTTTLVDAEGLGICVSELASEQQAKFLLGLAEGFSRFDTELDQAMQCAYIADQFGVIPGAARGVAGLLRNLAEHIEGVI